MSDSIDIGVFGEDDKVLYLEKRQLTAADNAIEIVVDEEPVEAGIDPFNKLIDRNPEDNVTAVSPTG